MNAHVLSCLLAVAAATAATAAPAEETYLARTRVALAHAGTHMAEITAAADATATALAAGGRFLAGGHPALVSEFSGRAGGLMVLKSMQIDQLTAGDVVLYAPGGKDNPEERAALVEKGATLVWLGAGAPENSHTVPVAEEAGLSPTLAGAVSGWVYMAEVIAALTRHGKMPVVYETIGGYGGYQRIAQYDAKGIYWHETHTVPPIPPGTLGPVYVASVSASIERVEREMAPRLAQVGQWVAEARAAGRRTIMYNMGHLFPNEVAETEIGTLFESATWNAGFLQFTPPDDTYAAGDVAIHIGYQHPPYRLLPRVRYAGGKVAYVSVLQERDYPTGADCIWIDPMWPWIDGVVTIPNYDVPACPASGVINSAIAWEIYRLSREAMI